VKPVNNIQVNVSLVKLTDLIHQPVTVLMVSILILIPENVLTVTSDVKLVMLNLLKLTEIVKNVPLIELMLLLVVALMVNMMTMKMSNVKIVVLDVEPVIEWDVPLVKITEC
jgi:hypothetical protein